MVAGRRFNSQWNVGGFLEYLVIHQSGRNRTGTPQTYIVDFAVAPVGVGSFAQSVLSFWKIRSYPCTVLAVEPDSAACLKSSLINGVSTTVPTDDTIMSGLNCGTVSSIDSNRTWK